MKVEIVQHDPKWSQLYQVEADKLMHAFGKELVSIHHIGSTSVPGLLAKPILDMMPVVQDIERVELLNEQMESLGYEALGEFGMLGRRYFRKGGDARTHQVHIFQKNDKWNIDRHLAVKEFLNSHPAEVKLYGELKESLAKKFPNDRISYVDGKNTFVKYLEKRAFSWYGNGQ